MEKLTLKPKRKVVSLALIFCIGGSVFFGWQYRQENFTHSPLTDLNEVEPQHKEAYTVEKAQDTENELLNKIEKIKAQQKLSHEMLGSPITEKESPLPAESEWHKSSEKLNHSIENISKMRENLARLMLEGADSATIQDLDAKLLDAISAAQNDQEKMLEDYKKYQLELQKQAQQLLAKGV